MINRIYIKDYLSFDEVLLSLEPGLSVFTGVSGAGKSVLMSAILAVFGFCEAGARIIEADVDGKFDASEFGIETTEISTFKLIKDKSLRYFINNQFVSKKNLLTLSQTHLKYLSAKENSEFENEKILAILDNLVCKNNPNFKEILSNFKLKFGEFSKIKKELDEINEKENRLEELKEFALFEIEKIEKISPKIGEFDELMSLKKRLSKKDKIEHLWQRANAVFELENVVLEALQISEIDSNFFSDCMNELRFAKESVNLEDLEGLDVGEILDRIEALNSLIKRYGSIEESLLVLKNRKDELKGYEQISFQKDELQRQFNELNKEVLEISSQITKARKSSLQELVQSINFYLKKMYLSEVELEILQKDIDALGRDLIKINLNNINLNKISSGEMNRLRLAFIASAAQVGGFDGGVLILDEIDANLSGKEAMSIADVLCSLSKHYQIFAISHQPQLSSRADSHFLVDKVGDKSFVKKLNYDDRVLELARMISGDEISPKAINFAKELLN